jgi:hypothetical protein
MRAPDFVQRRQRLAEYAEYAARSRVHLPEERVAAGAG